MVVSENFAGKSLGTGVGKIWYRKKYQYRYRKYLVPEKVSVLVSFNILGTVTHWHTPCQTAKRGADCEVLDVLKAVSIERV